MTPGSTGDTTPAPVEVDSQKCIGVGTCVGLAPSAFKMDSTGVARVQETASETSQARLDEAVASCPMQAISRVER